MKNIVSRFTREFDLYGKNYFILQRIYFVDRILSQYLCLYCSPGFKLLDVYRKYAPLANEHKGSDVFPLEPKGASNYHLGGDKEALRQRFLDAGYSKVVTWYTSGHFPWFNGEQYADVYVLNVCVTC